MTPKIRHIKFDPVLHRYTDEEDFVYTSVTTKVGEFERKFDEVYWAKKEAEKTGKPVQYILDKWKHIREYACEKGNVVHEKLENSVNDSAIGKIDYNTSGNNSLLLTSHKRNPIWGYEIDIDSFETSPLAVCYPVIYNCIHKYIQQGWKLYAEKRVYLFEYLIAGTIDLLLVRNNDFIIIDWKTNKDDVLHFDAGYYKKVNGIKTNTWVSKNETLLPPLQHISNSKGEKYTLQLSTYAFLAEAWGHKCISLLLFHIKEKTIEAAKVIDKKSNAEIKLHAIQYRKQDVYRMLTWKGNKQESNEIDFTIK